MARTRRKTETAPVDVETKVETTAVEQKPVPKTKVYTTNAPLNLRNKAGDMSKDAIITVIPANTKIVGLGGEKDTPDGVHWIEVRHGKTRGWVNSFYVK